MNARPIALASLLLAVLACVLLLRGGGGQDLVLRLDNASQLVKGNQVKVGGLPVGTVKSISLSDEFEASVRVHISDPELVPVRAGTQAFVRQSSLSSVANRYIALELGPSNAKPLADGAAIPVTDTRSAVDLDAVIATLDADTRTQLQRLTKGAAGLYEGDGAQQLNRGLVMLNPAVAQLESTLSEVTRDRAAFERLVVSGASWVSAVADRRAELEAGLGGAAQTATAVAGETEALQSLLGRAPATLRHARVTLTDTAETLDAVVPAVREAQPVAPRLSRTLRDLRPVLERLPAAVDELHPLTADLVRWLRGVPAVTRIAVPALRSAAAAVAASLPIVTALRPYAPDVLLGATNGFGGTAAGPYDANGGYGRIGALTGALGASAGAGSNVTDPPPGVTFHNTARCPGAGTQVSHDGSNTYREDAPCDPSQRP
jgi:phospholipid/cholesterol/gamma-HCH transport system substrate-binding protein